MEMFPWMTERMLISFLRSRKCCVVESRARRFSMPVHGGIGTVVAQTADGR